MGPIFASETHGYDTVDHRRIDPRLGTDDDFDRLVGAALARGLLVNLYGVFNQVGRRHPIAEAALAGGPASDAGRLLRSVGDGDNRRFVPFEGHDILLTLDHDHPAVAELVVDVMRHWLDRGADAWRLDAAYAVPPRFWAAVLPQVRRTHPDVWFEAEVLHGDYAAFVDASTADTVTQYELWKAIWSSINDRNMHELAWALTRHNAMLDTFVPATFIGNHDVTRIATRITDARHRDHAVVLLAVLGGTPTVYAGDEYGLTGLKEDREGGDDAIRPEFLASPDLLDARDERMYRLHQRLIGFRRRHPWLHRARTEPVTLANDHVTLAIVAPANTDGHRFEVTINLGEQAIGLDTSTLIEADDHTRGGDGFVAAHGWAICEVRSDA